SGGSSSGGSSSGGSSSGGSSSGGSSSGGSSSGGSSSGNTSPGSGNHTTTLGNQQLTLEATPTPTSTSTMAGRTRARACYARRASIRFTLRRHTLRHAAKLRFQYVTFALGKKVKRSTRLPATVRFPLRRLARGVHTINVRAFFTEALARAGKRSGHKLEVTLRRTLKTRFRVC
ncbi:MAG: hypothetical protein ACRDLT_13090, partial [Solirubrobacteraceae bacterium]